MKMRTLVDIRRLAGRTARIGTVRSKGVRSRTTVPSLSSAAKSHAGACAIPRCSRTPILICSISLVRKTPVGIIRCTSFPEPKLQGCMEPRSTKTADRNRWRSSGDSGAPYRVRYCGGTSGACCNSDQESRREERVRLANILPATASGMNLSLGWPPKAVADRFLLSAFTNLIPLLGFVQ
jgi:hypothetical protein